MQRFQHQLRGENPAPRARLCPVTAGPPCCVCYPHRAAPRAALPRAGPQPIPSYRLRWGALGSPAPYGVRAVEGAAFSLVRKGGGDTDGKGRAVLPAEPRCPPLAPNGDPWACFPRPPRLSLLPPWPPVTLGAPRLEVPSPVPLPSPAQPPASARCLPLSPRFPSLGPSFSPCLLRPSALSPGPGRSPQQYR